MPDDERRDDHPKPRSLGSCGAAALTVANVSSGESGGNLALVPGLDCERRFPRDPIESRANPLSSREGLPESSRDDERDDMKECPEFRLRAAGIFCVSMAAGGFLLNRFPAMDSAAFNCSNSLFCFLSISFFSRSSLLFSFLLLLPPKSDQLGDKQISGAAVPFSPPVAFVLTPELSMFARLVSTDNEGAITGRRKVLDGGWEERAVSGDMDLPRISELVGEAGMFACALVERAEDKRCCWLAVSPADLITQSKAGKYLVIRQRTTTSGHYYHSQAGVRDETWTAQ